MNFSIVFLELVLKKSSWNSLLLSMLYRFEIFLRRKSSARKIGGGLTTLLLVVCMHFNVKQWKWRYILITRPL